MTRRIVIFLLAALCATAPAQTIRTLGYNSTNGQIVANTGTNVLRFTNDVSFGGGPIINGDGIAYAQGTNVVISFELRKLLLGEQTIFEWQTDQFILSVPLAFNSTNNAAVVRTNLGLGAFKNPDNYAELLNASGQTILDVEDGVSVFRAISWQGTNNETYKADTRTNLGLGLAALTNTSNVDTMRALAGSTNTNHPYSGSISVVGTNNTNTLVFTNGILKEVQ